MGCNCKKRGGHMAPAPAPKPKEEQKPQEKEDKKDVKD